MEKFAQQPLPTETTKTMELHKALSKCHKHGDKDIDKTIGFLRNMMNTGAETLPSMT